MSLLTRSLHRTPFTPRLPIRSLSTLTPNTPFPTKTISGSTSLHHTSPADKLPLTTITSEPKTLVIGLPGAFTPGCSSTHIPGYIQNYSELQKKGIEKIFVVSVNDAFVMKAWKESFTNLNKSLADKFVFLADIDASLVKTIGMDWDASGVLGNVRSKRFVAVLEKGVVKKVFEEPDKTGLSCSLAKNVLTEI